MARSSSSRPAVSACPGAADEGTRDLEAACAGRWPDLRVPDDERVGAVALKRAISGGTTALEKTKTPACALRFGRATEFHQRLLDAERAVVLRLDRRARRARQLRGLFGTKSPFLQFLISPVFRPTGRKSRGPFPTRTDRDQRLLERRPCASSAARWPGARSRPVLHDGLLEPAFDGEARRSGR